MRECPRCGAPVEGKANKVYCSRTCKERAAAKRNWKVRAKNLAGKHHEPKTQARYLVRLAVKRKDMPPIESVQCCKCSSPAEAYHHPDYNFPLYVLPLCEPCHLKEHDT